MAMSIEQGHEQKVEDGQSHDKSKTTRKESEAQERVKWQKQDKYTEQEEKQEEDQEEEQEEKQEEEN